MIIIIAVATMILFSVCDVVMAILFFSQGQYIMGLIVLAASYFAAVSAAAGLSALYEKD